MKLNLGCGKDVREGWVNVDKYPHPGVTACDLDASPLPFQDATFEYIFASHVLEHVLQFDGVMFELHRILTRGGLLHVRVPYGLRGMQSDANHRRSFTKATILRLVTDHPTSLQDSGPWKLESLRIHRGGFPEWHVQRYLRLRMKVGIRKQEIEFVLRKI